MGLFSNSTASNTTSAQAPAPDKKSPAYAVGRFNVARTNLFLAVLLTVINIVLGCIGANAYLLFSIAFPYFMFDIADIVWSIPAVLVLILFFLYWLLSKKHPGFMIAALVTFIADCLFLVVFSIFTVGITEGEISFSEFILDYLTHIWVLVYLIIGTVYTRRYKKAIKEYPEIVEGSLLHNANVPSIKAPAEEVSDVYAEDLSAEEAAAGGESSDSENE